MSIAPILEMKNITKTFPGVKALSNVSFQVAEGEIHCLVGENGAGKSTLMKVLSGVYPHGTYAGEILFDGQVQKFASIRDSEKAGIAIIYQELALVPEMTVYENIFLGNEIRKGVTDRLERDDQAGDRMPARKSGSTSTPRRKVKNLGVGKQQLVEIAKALSKDVKLLILDEPTAALNEDDSENLLEPDPRAQRTRRHLRHDLPQAEGSHRHRRHGHRAARRPDHLSPWMRTRARCPRHVLIKNMVGREIDNIYPPARARRDRRSRAWR